MDFYATIDFSFIKEEIKFSNISSNLIPVQNAENITSSHETTLESTGENFEIIEITDEGSKPSNSEQISPDDFIIEEISEDDNNFTKIEENLSEFLQIQHEFKKTQQSFPCLLCNLNFPNKFNLERHFASARHQKTENDFIASEHHEKLSLDEMIVEDTPDDFDVINSHFCKECYLMFDKLTDYKSHMRNSHSIFKCEKCSRRFRSENEFNKHMSRHEKSKDFACGFCDKKFTNNQNLRRHERAHVGLMKFVCGVCSKNYDQKTNLTRHLKVHGNY